MPATAPRNSARLLRHSRPACYSITSSARASNLSIARRNDRGGLHHEDHASFGRARTVHHFFWNDEALTRQQVIPGSDPSIGTAPTTFE